MKKILCMILALAVVAITLVACGNGQKLDRIDTGNTKHITIATQANTEPKFDIVRRKGIVELVDLNNTTAFVETDKVKAEDLLADTLYTFTFYNYDEKEIAKCSFSPKGYVFKGSDLTTPYQLTTEFDAKAIEEVIKLYDVEAKPD